MHFVRSWQHVLGLGFLTLLLLVVALERSCSAEVVQILESDKAAFEARLDLIERATDTLDVAYFIVEADCISHRFLHALLDAAHRGVCVRLIVDAMYNDIDDCMLRQLLAAGVRIKEYHPLTIKQPLRITRRMHDKILIRDRVEMVVGSRNIEDAHFGISLVRKNFIDIDLHVTGCVLQQANSYYQCLWASEQLGDAEPEEESSLKKLLCVKAKDADSACDSQGHPLCPCKRDDGEEPDPMLCCSQRYQRLMSGALDCRPDHQHLAVPCVKLLFDPNGKKDKNQGVRQSLYQILHNAKCSIVLQSPYIIPDRELGRILRCAARRGVSVKILTNSLLTTDQVLAYSAFLREAPECARAGIEFWECGGSKCLHAKSFIVDNQIACITTFNFDSRSAHLNTELATVIHDEGFAAELQASMDRNFHEAYPMHLDGRKLVSSPQLQAADPARVRQLKVYGSVSTLNRVPGVSPVSEGGLRLLQGVSRIIQRQL